MLVFSTIYVSTFLRQIEIIFNVHTQLGQTEFLWTLIFLLFPKQWKDLSVLDTVKKQHIGVLQPVGDSRISVLLCQNRDYTY